MRDYKWTIQRFFKRLHENGKPFIRDLAFDSWAIVKLPYQISKDIYRFAKRVFEFKSVIWNDCDFDYSSVLDMMKFKITRLRNHMAHHDCLVNTKKYVKQMDEALVLIDRIREDNYDEKFRAEMESKWGKNVCWSNDGPFENKHIGSQITFRYEKENYKNFKEVAKDRKVMWRKEASAREKDWNKLWKLLNENLRNWWD